MNFYYSCSECGIRYSLRPDLMLCPDCSQRQEKDRPLRGILDVDFTVTKAKKILYKLLGIRNLRISSLMPVSQKYTGCVPVGNTPLWKPAELRKKTGYSGLYLKDETRNPTGSIKDRGMLLVSAYAAKYGFTNIHTSYAGNTGASIAGICAATGIRSNLFLREDLKKTDLTRHMQYGAGISDAGDFKKFTEQNRSISADPAFNPLTIEGIKTAALEIVKELGRPPDYLFVPAGEGVVLSGMYKGFIDLIKLNLIKKPPVIYAVQAAGSNAICRALRDSDFMTISRSKTIADSLATNNPVNGYHAIKNINRYQGKCLVVTDEEILKAQIELAAYSGLLAEPSASAVLAGFHKAGINIPKNSIVVLLVTGNSSK